MAVNHTTSRWKLLLAASFSVLALACGDDGGKGNEDNEPPANGVVLGKGIVGKECAADTDCGPGGLCKKTQSIGGASEFLNLFGFDTAITAPGGYCSIGCVNDSNCGEGGACVGAIGAFVTGECRKRCTAPGDCRTGYECAKPATTADGGVVGGPLTSGLPAQCQALPPTPQLNPNQAGAACDTRADAGVALNSACGAGTCGGGSCTAVCVSDATCGAGSACVPNGVYGTTGSCRETCAQDADCNQYTPTGSVGCTETNGRKLCTQKLFPLEPNKLGIACTEDTECGRGGSCAETIGGGFPGTNAPGGYCTLIGCEDDSVCTGGVCVTGAFPLPNRCFDSCSVDGECRTGYSCQERPTTGDVNAKVCTPKPTLRDGGTAALVVGGLDGGV